MIRYPWLLLSLLSFGLVVWLSSLVGWWYAALNAVIFLTCFAWGFTEERRRRCKGRHSGDSGSTPPR